MTSRWTNHLAWLTDQPTNTRLRVNPIVIPKGRHRAGSQPLEGKISTRLRKGIPGVDPLDSTR